MNNKQPLVYIILLNYNGYKDTIECVKSLEKISYENYKILIVDNNSSDNSEKILKENITEHIILQTGNNLGFAGGNNIGIKYAVDNGADYVLLLNNDTIVDKDFLSILVKEYGNDESVGLAIGKIYYYYNSERIWYAGGQLNEFKGNAYHFGIDEIDTGKYNEQKYVTFATGCCLLVARDIIKKVGLLSEEYFLYFEDTDYCCKIRNMGYNILFCPRSIIYHKVSVSTGKMSPMSQYYMSRNRLIFIFKNINGYKKVAALLFFYFTRIVKAVLFKQDNKSVIKGIRDVSKFIKR